jgi:uncharacterized metal-binding protein YceD (DUF177 family)
MSEHDENFSRLVRAAQIKEAPQAFDLVVDAPARRHLAAAFGLPGIAALRGRFALHHEAGGVIAATLHITAQVTQTCVITLEPVDQTIDETVALRFVPVAMIPEAEDSAELDPETLDGPDEIPFTGDKIDLGAALTEQLALSLDPYPRKPGAALPAEAMDSAANPFAALRKLSDKEE